MGIGHDSIPWPLVHGQGVDTGGLGPHARDPGRGGYPVGRMLSTALTSRIDGGTM